VFGFWLIKLSKGNEAGAEACLRAGER